MVDNKCHSWVHQKWDGSKVTHAKRVDKNELAAKKRRDSEAVVIERGGNVKAYRLSAPKPQSQYGSQTVAVAPTSSLVEDRSRPNDSGKGLLHEDIEGEELEKRGQVNWMESSLRIVSSIGLPSYKTDR